MPLTILGICSPENFCILPSPIVLNAEHRKSKSTLYGGVLMPPPVPAGEAPTNIKNGSHKLGCIGHTSSISMV